MSLLPLLVTLSTETSHGVNPTSHHISPFETQIRQFKPKESENKYQIWCDEVQKITAAKSTPRSKNQNEHSPDKFLVC